LTILYLLNLQIRNNQKFEKIQVRSDDNIILISAKCTNSEVLSLSLELSN